MEALTRQETLTILASMGVELPSATKMPDDALQKRLRQALNSAQYISNVLSNPPLDPAALSAWPSGRSVYDGVRRGNFEEAMQNYQRKLQGKDVELYKNPMMDARQTLMGITQWWDQGHKWMVLQDPAAEQCAINIRLLSVRELDKETPVLVLLYQSVTQANVAEGLAWLRAMQDRHADSPGYLVNIKATPLEQKLLLRLLAINGKLLSHTYKPKREPAERNFKASFFLPLGPLSFEDIGRLNSDPGCVLCGQKTTSRCSQCQSVAYCGADCQKTDWPHHKRVCRSLHGGAWRTVRFVTVVPGTEGMYAAALNKYASELRDAIRPQDPAAAPPNVHGARLFLVKLQVSLGGTPTSIMVYDRQRSVQGYFMRRDSPEVFGEMLQEMQGPRGGYGGVKMFRWAKRVSDWELSVCLDREPQTEIKW
ncbi:hypothetical protein DAEQUDRAFT_565796 [Daedalea quercina L-15889]|uniref:MYND-type domain-containing protein n=1 Tax=Daedalea quercina L-15889 TaxID=1314783 RepID=A0A165LXD1_9APHY|nr:hypothetical protein DAEQUDRAFT_565796 [Daedalea quercina L-15889]